MSSQRKGEPSPQGLTHDDALHVIVNIQGDPRESLRVTVASFVNQTLYEADAKPYQTRQYKVVGQTDPSLPNLWTAIKASDAHDGFFKTATMDVVANHNRGRN
jgi:hypothetical protein